MRRHPLSWLLAAVSLLVLAVPVTGRAQVRIDGVPQFSHVVTIVLENENFDTTWNTPDASGHATYLQSLRANGVFADHYYGISHVSADNYIAMTSGQPATPLFNADCIASWGACEGFEKAWPDGGRSIADQVEGSGLSWKAYMDGMDVPCKHPSQTAVPDPYQTGYATRHDPFVYYPPIVESTTRCNARVVPYTQLATDLLSEATTPNYVFITPDTCHDGHDSPCTGADANQPGAQPGGLTAANAWLSTEVPKLLASPAFTTSGVNSLLIITFDENGISDLQGCCTTTGAIGGRIGLLAIGSTGSPLQLPGTTVSATYDHWSYLRTVEDMLGIGEHLNVSGLPTTQAMTGLFT